MQETYVRSLGWEDPLEKEMATAPVFLPRESYGQRSLADRSPQGKRESDTTEVTWHCTAHRIVEYKDRRPSSTG